MILKREMKQKKIPIVIIQSNGNRRNVNVPNQVNYIITNFPTNAIGLLKGPYIYGMLVLIWCMVEKTGVADEILDSKYDHNDADDDKDADANDNDEGGDGDSHMVNVDDAKPSGKVT